MSKINNIWENNEENTNITQRYDKKEVIINGTIKQFNSIIEEKNIDGPIPYFESKNDDKPQEGKETLKRKNTIVIIKHPEGKKYVVLDWQKFWWKSFVIWWLEWDEDYEQAAVRETIEETWFSDIKDVRTLTWELHTNFYAKHKDVNRYSIEKYILIRLKSLEIIWVDENEVSNHIFTWIDEKNIWETLNLDNNRYVWHLFSKWREIDEDFLNTLDNFSWFKK